MQYVSGDYLVHDKVRYSLQTEKGRLWKYECKNSSHACFMRGTKLRTRAMVQGRFDLSYGCGCFIMGKQYD